MLNNYIKNYLHMFDVSSTGTLGISFSTDVVNIILAKKLAGFFLFADILLYMCVICVVFITAARYASEHAPLTKLLIKINQVTCYVSLSIVIIGTFLYSDLLSSATISIFSGMYLFTISTQITKIIILFIFIAMLAIFPKSNNDNFRHLELPLLMSITLALSVTIASAANFALFLLALEGFSLTLYVMTALGRTYGGITASVKYFGFGTLGSIFLFWGTVHIYSLVPSLSTNIINEILNNSFQQGAFMQNALNFATTAITFGFMLKLGAAPTHQWVADTYAGVHMYVTAYFSIFVKAVIFLLFLRVAVNFTYDSLLIQFTILSLLIGCFMSINQSEIKRLLAYSSVVHVGFLLMGDGQASIIYLITYLLSSLLIFSVLVKTSVSSKELIYMNDLKFIRKGNIFDVFTLTVALASSAGLPPFAGFYGKFAVWSSLVEDIYLTNSPSAYLCLFTSIAITLVTIFYYMRVVAYLFLQNDASLGSISQSATPEDFYKFFLSIGGGLVTVLIFWSALHVYIIKIAQLFCLFL